VGDCADAAWISLSSAAVIRKIDRSGMRIETLRNRAVQIALQLEKADGPAALSLVASRSLRRGDFLFDLDRRDIE
jgi:hypothetical protein